MNRISLSQNSQGFQEIDYTPHYHAITNAGKSQFSRVIDATAELVDNSIQASSTNSHIECRNINVEIHLKNLNSNGYLIVFDNGKGMNEKDLQEFATYSLDQETRGNKPSFDEVVNNSNSFISKFGVGAKQAGFFLDPYPNNNDPNLGPTQALSKQLAGELTGANLGETCRIEGYLFYFPYKSGHETRPLSYVNDEGIEDETTRYNNDPNVRIYWQKRLVPESTLKSLPFFPAFASKSQCITEKVPEKWRWRIKGFIFFDWNFRHISNNKLKIRVDNFEDWIHSKEVLKHISYSPSQCPANFKKFLQLCHAQYDKEFRLEGRDKILENALNTTFQIIPNSAFFTRVKIGNKHSIVKDEKIKIPLKGSKGLVYGKVIGFEVKEQLDPDENLYFGPANIWYSREPADIYGDKISIKHHPSIALIKFDETESFRVTKLDIETLRKLAPIDFKVGLFTSEGENPEIIKANAPFDVYTGVQYHKFGVQVINRKNEQICFIPPSSIDRYKVRVLYSNMPYDDKQDLHIYDESKGKDVKLTNFKEKALIMKAWYSFGNYDNGDKYKLEFTSIGQHKLKVILIDTVSAGVDQVILSKEYTINVRSVLIADFSLNVIDESTTLPLGNFLPKLSVEFQDQSKNPVDFESRIKITIKSNDMTVVCDNLSEPLFLVEASDHGLLNFDTCWMAIPKTDTKFFKDMNYILSERVVEFEVSIFTTNKNKSDEPEDYDIAIGNPKKFKLKFCPGRPYQLMLLDPFKVNDSYHIDEVIPYLKLGCVDQWGNRTGPRLGATWTISLDPNGPLKVYDENEFPMTSIGEVTIRNLKIEEMENHNELIGYETTQTFYLSINDKSFSFPPDEPDIVMPSQINFKEEPELTIKFLITSSNSPDHLEIRYQGVVISNPYELIVSTVLSDLSFHVIDGKGNEIEFQSDWFQKNNTGLTSNDSIDLQSKIYGIQIVDKFDNEITLNAVLSEDVPLLLYMSDEPTEDVINEWIMNNYLQDGKRNKRKLSDPCDTQSSKRLRTDSGGAENSLEVNDLRNKNYIKQIELSYSKEKGYFILNPDSAIETKTVPSIIWLIAIDEYNTQDSIDNVGLTLGLYEVNVSYTEQRESMTSLPGVLKSIQSKLRIQVIPGLPTKISPTLEGVRSLTGAIASNSISCNPNERVIAENISINLYDDYSNSCTFPSDVLVKCVLNRQSNYELPILENSNDDGELFGVVSEDRNEFHFEKIAIKPNTGKNVKKLVAELGFVEDEKEAQILSWAAVYHMDALVVADTQTGNELYKQNIKNWPMDQINKFYIEDRTREQPVTRTRNSDEIKTRQLPFPSLDGYAGNPKYMVNLIQLEESEEYLRDSLFYSIYMKSILFDDMISATAYRKKLIELKKMPPTIYTRNGEKISMEGILNPNKTNRLPPKLPYVYGQLPLVSDKDIQLLDSG
eukprot:gene17835-23447_t